MTGRHSQPNILEPGSQVALGVDEQGRRRWHSGRVVQIDEQTAWIEVALGVDGLPRLAEGTTVYLYCWRPRDARYVTPGRILPSARGEEDLLRVQLQEARRIQQRKYFRVPVVNTTEPGLVASSSGDQRLTRLQLREISASGFRARSDYSLEVGDHLQIRLRLPGQLEAFDVGAVVVRVLEGLQPGDAQREFAATFEALPEEVLERIVRFTLRTQRETIRREALV